LLDPFLGIGNTVTAGQSLQVRRVIGFDIDEGYLQVAAEKSGAEIRPVGGREGGRLAKDFSGRLARAKSGDLSL
jgi:hypothetical protein